MGWDRSVDDSSYTAMALGSSLFFFSALFCVIILPRDVSSYRRPRNKCDCVCGVGERGQRIVGGRQALEHEFPWIATLSYNGTFYCGASLITSRHLVTAAHCLHGKSAKYITVGLGDHDRSRQEPGEVQALKVRRALPHPGFSLSKIIHDIGIVELVRPVHHSPPAIRTACLPSTPGLDYNGMQGEVAGWGRDREAGSVLQILHKVSLPLINHQDCGSKYGYSSKKIHPTNFCAGLAKGSKDACQGDSGGPLHLNVSEPKAHMELIGVVSWGRGCARPNYPGVYTRVDKYLNWIMETVGDECLCQPPLSGQ